MVYKYKNLLDFRTFMKRPMMNNYSILIWIDKWTVNHIDRAKTALGAARDLFLLTTALVANMTALQEDSDRLVAN